MYSIEGNGEKRANQRAREVELVGEWEQKQKEGKKEDIES